MNGKFRLKTSSSLGRNRPDDKDKLAYVDELRKASPVKSRVQINEFAVVVQGLGRSEKFSEKSKILEILKTLKYLKTDSDTKTFTRLTKVPSQSKNEFFSAMFDSHQVYRKIHTPYSPGVVRIQSQQSLAQVVINKSSSKSPVKTFIIRSATPGKSIARVTSESFSSQKPLNRVKNSNSLIRIQSKKGPIRLKEKEKLKAKAKEKNGFMTRFHSTYKLSYKGEFLNDLAHGNGRLKFDSGHKISGTFSKGYLEDGFAVIRYKDTSMYRGDIKAGVREGSGNMQYHNGGVYKGKWVKDQRNGLGVILYEGNFFFEGFFANDYTDGPGVLVKKHVFLANPNTKRSNPSGIYRDIEGSLDKASIFEDLSNFPNFSSLPVDPLDLIYITLPHSSKFLQSFHKFLPSGKFISGKLTGAGMAIYGNYATYIGNFKNGLRNGFGKMTYSDPEHNCEWLPETEGEYIGEWWEDKRHGLGEMLWKKGTKYVGKFIQDHRHNVTGIVTFHNDDICEVGFVNDKMEGKCILYKSKKKVTLKGHFFSGIFFNDEAVVEFNDGRVYQGEVFKDLPHGVGVLKCSNGDVYEGMFCEGNFEGFGKMVYINGDVYEGNWENNLRSGKGYMVSAKTQKKIEGNWLNGIKIS